MPYTVPELDMLYISFELLQILIFFFVRSEREKGQTSYYLALCNFCVIVVAQTMRMDCNALFSVQNIAAL